MSLMQVYRSVSSLFLIYLSFSCQLSHVEANSGGKAADDRFQVFEACDVKYGFLDVNPNAPPPPPPAPGQIPFEHNKPLEECHQMYYRQKFCRNQLKELKQRPYQRICKSFNKHHLKFYATVFGVIGIGAFIRTVLKLYKINLPYTVCLILLGMGLGALSNITNFCPIWTPYTKVARTPPKLILYVFLPILIFESSFNMKAHLFFKSGVSILILALPGMLITTAVTALLCHQFFFSYDWSLTVSMLFGSIISATDPVAVVSILKEVGTSETLGILVDGESLLNDGVAILLYEIFTELIADETSGVPSGNPTVKIIIMFCRITLGGPLFGWFTAKLTIFYLSLIYNDAAVEVSVTLCSAFLTYFIGEFYLGVSGVMALVLLGITLSSERTCISPEVQKLVHDFWEMLGYLANTVLFVLVGILVTETAITSFKLEDGYYLIFLYFALNIVRLLMIGLMSPLLSRIGYGLSWQNMVVMSWGGLRGAVGICLALQTFKDKTICDQTKIGPKILLQTAGIVILTLLVNGTTTKALLNMLKLTELSVGKIQDMANAVRQIRSAQRRTVSILRHDKMLADADWGIVDESTKIVNPYVEMNVKCKEQDDNEDVDQTPSIIADIDEEAVGPKCPVCSTSVENEPSVEEIKEMTEEARLRLLKALKVSCWRQYEQGVLTEDAVQILVDKLESTEDRKFEMVHAKDFEKYWEMSGLFFYLRKKLLPFVNEGFYTDTYPVPKEPWRGIFHKLSKSYCFSVIIYLIILANMIPVIWEAYYISIDYYFSRRQLLIFFLTNMGFTAIYGLEFFIKVAGMGFGEYMSSKWNIADVIILIISTVELILSGTYLKSAMEIADLGTGAVRSRTAQEADFLKFIRFIRLARVTRILRFFKPLFPFIMTFLNNQVNKKIFLGYDIGKGFVAATDDVQKFLPQMVDHPRVLLKFKASLEAQRVEVIREMGLLQKEHPGIAIAVKTRHASRAILNLMRGSLNELKEDGLVDEKEYDSLMEAIEQKMKQLWSSPSWMKPASAELTLANLSWMSVSNGSRELFEFIYKQATLITFMKDDVICNQKDPPNGVYVIVSGLVKVQYDPEFEYIVHQEEFGIIPNTEVFQDLTFSTEMEDYFTTGSVIGELGVLTSERRAAKVICETGVMAYHIPQSVMKTAIESFVDPYDSLEARIWRTYGMRMAATLLPNEPSFAAWTMDKVKTYVELSAVPSWDKNKALLIPEFISDVILIYGQVSNFNDPDEIFTAPYVIPKTCTHIRPLSDSKVLAKLLIIANQDAEHLAEDEDDEDNENNHGSTHEDGHLSHHNHLNTSNASLQRYIIVGTRAASITETEALSIQLQRQSRALNFGVAPQKSSTMLKESRISMKGIRKSLAPGHGRGRGRRLSRHT